MQIALTFRNTLRNVKRRVLHTRASAMCYITRHNVAVAFAAHNVADDGNPIYFAIVMTRLNNEPMRLCPLDSLQSRNLFSLTCFLFPLLAPTSNIIHKFALLNDLCKLLTI